MKPHIQILHCSLLRSINHLFFFFFLCTDLRSDSRLETKLLLGLRHRQVCRVPRFLWKYARFLMPLSPLPPTSTVSPRLMEMLASYRCWPVVPLFETCSPCFSLEGNGDRLISPDAHSPGKKGEKKKGGWRSSQLHWAPSSTAETHSGKKRKCPFHEFVLLELSLYSKKCSVRRPAWDISRRLNITNYKYKKTPSSLWESAVKPGKNPFKSYIHNVKRNIKCSQ